MRRFHDRISTEECFYCDIDLSQTDVPSGKLREFFFSAMEEAESLTTACVDRLQAKPLKK
jgi:hypothetical protein